MWPYTTTTIIKIINCSITRLPQVTSGYYGYRPTHRLFPQFPTTVNHKYVRHLCNCATSQIIHRWSQKVFILLKSAFSLSRIFLRSVQVIVCMKNLFLFITESYPMIWIY